MTVLDISEDDHGLYEHRHMSELLKARVDAEFTHHYNQIHGHGNVNSDQEVRDFVKGTIGYEHSSYRPNQEALDKQWAEYNSGGSTADAARPC